MNEKIIFQKSIFVRTLLLAAKWKNGLELVSRQTIGRKHFHLISMHEVRIWKLIKSFQLTLVFLRISGYPHIEQFSVIKLFVPTGIFGDAKLSKGMVSRELVRNLNESLVIFQWRDPSMITD